VSLEELSAMLAEAAAYTAQNRLAVLYGDEPIEGSPYGWQREFHAKGATEPERGIIAANQTGKTRSAAAEVAIHLTGQYPSWWTGRRFSGPIEAIVAGQTNEDVRDIQQLALFGPIEEGKKPEGTGWVPKDCIGRYGFRQCGLSNVIDSVRVRHVSGGWSDCQLKSYAQGKESFTGRTKDLAWLDEEPEDYGIFTECETRLLVKRGSLMFTVTPLRGMSEIVQHFLTGGPGIWYITIAWEDAPHITPELREQWKARYPEHERNTRTKGIPMMGTGLVYPVDHDSLLCDPFPIPSHFRRIAGSDFGIGHPAAGCWLAWNADADVIYVYDAYKQTGETAAYHAQAFMARGKWIPVAWPHDGLARDKGSGEPLADQYRHRGANMLPEPASWDLDYQREQQVRAQSREAGSNEILERMRTGRWKVFNTPGARLFLDDIRLMHRKGTPPMIVPLNDDVESAGRYGVMMLRYAVSEAETEEEPGPPQKDYDPLKEFSLQ
jgi:phage terminase large subunit-like protein